METMAKKNYILCVLNDEIQSFLFIHHISYHLETLENCDHYLKICSFERHIYLNVIRSARN